LLLPDRYPDFFNSLETYLAYYISGNLHSHKIIHLKAEALLKIQIVGYYHFIYRNEAETKPNKIFLTDKK